MNSTLKKVSEKPETRSVACRSIVVHFSNGPFFGAERYNKNCKTIFKFFSRS